MRLLLLSAVTACLLLVAAGESCVSRPNIIMVLADDLGWSDVSYDGTRDPALKTSHIDYMNRNGIRMLSTYTPPNCSPSRHCVLSGIYPYRFGNQDNGISVSTAGHIPLNSTILPQKLRQLNYKTHMIGKWHQGFCDRAQTPINRGFSSWLGFYLGKGDHYTHFGKKGAYDLRFAVRPDDVDDSVIMDEGIILPSDSLGRYSTELFSQRAVDIVNEHADAYGTDGCKPFFILLSLAAIHGPNQAPQKFLDACQHIEDTPSSYSNKMKELDGRRYKCAMMMSVDEGLKNISDALEATGQASNTLIAFTSDNGGSWTQGSSNFPLRGGKTTLWEGGIRVPSFIYSPSTDILPYQNWDWSGLHYQTDWYPTFVGFAEKQGDNYAEAWDGINHWDTLVNQKSGSERTEFAYINEVQEEHGVLRINDLKLLVNQTRYPGWYLPPNQEWSEYPDWILPEGITAKEPRVKSRLSLFNIAKDPSETLDLMNPPKPKRPEGMVRPNKDDYGLEPKPVKPTDTSDPNYADLLDQYKNVDKPAWDEKKAIYDADLAAFLALKEAYDSEIKAWRKERRANREVGYEMLNYLYEKYWGEMWKPTITAKLPSNPITLSYTIPNYTPLTYVWSSGWCDASNDADPST